MATFTAAAFLLAGFVLLIKGADWLVDGASTLAQRIGISDLVIGLTIVSFGTSAPEFLINVIASLQGNADIAVGNIVGSNISNTLLIIGLTAIIAPLSVKRSTVVKEIPFCLLAGIMLFVMANDVVIDGKSVSELSRSDGIAFVGFFLIFLYYTFGIRHRSDPAEGYSPPKHSIPMSGALMLLGFVGLSLGGKLAVDNAVKLSMTFGVSEGLVGLTVIALGTSLPELATSVVAARKGNADIAVGNIVGSNIFNIFWILGISSIIKPLPFAATLDFDLIIVILSVFLLFIFVHTGRIDRRLLWWKQKDNYLISRMEGIPLLATYVMYVVIITMRG